MDAQAVTQALLTPDGRADPYPLYAEAHRLGAVSAISDGWYLVPGYAAASQLLRNPAFGPPGPQARTPSQPERPALALMSLSVLESSPPGHGRMRSVLSSSFTPRRVAALEPAITSAVDTLLGRLAGAGEPADFMEEFAYLLPVTVICELLGVPHADRDWFRPLARDLTAALEPLAGTPALDAADTAAGELAAYFTRLIAGRRAAPRRVTT